MQRSKSIITKTLYFATLLYFSYLMLLITLQYIPLRLDVAFLNIKYDIIDQKFYQLAFFSHVYTSIFVLLIGIVQFSSSIRIQFPKVHRLMGKCYVFLILVISSPSGLIMAFYANGGMISQFSFVMQAFIWFLFTLLALVYARNKQWTLHRNFMIRSLALTLSAITLRLLKWMIANWLEWPPMDIYRLVAWLGWLVNLGIAEIYIWKSKHLRVV
ncbi:DUF2306 domain-containing protein [Portibacter marinus]|uniref:DUF2306 domain-containing protein n=1 Tax=Portibacter marinus TaxID=2898660 RepID=UPI001F1F2F20|nr:DUF2306 domain-containing protein [Portibacter marinus]